MMFLMLQALGKPVVPDVKMIAATSVTPILLGGLCCGATGGFSAVRGMGRMRVDAGND